MPQVSSAAPQVLLCWARKCGQGLAPHSPLTAQLAHHRPTAEQVHSIGDWWEASPDSPFMCMAERAIQKEWGTQPLLVREGEPR